MVASALLKLTGPQLAKKGKRSVENLSNYIRIRTDNNKFIVKAPGEKSARSLNKNATLNDAINFRNNLFKEKGYSKNEINLLLQPPVPASTALY